MALNSIGNVTYINQASSATSALQANNMTHQTPLNHALFNEQMQKIEEVRPTEETHKLEDREGNGKREFEDENENEEELEDEEGKNFQENLTEEMQKNSIAVKKKQEKKIITEDEMLMKPEKHILDIKG
ncbi:hypothetical protein CQA53_09125 [Helicobacter didelphidarum]|uniref:Uncharacterized protein n=1 Tax=Helicobacter didelphidarum TaxID=2040648 RepID=A0A3D8IC06_9HELI|nr:hypothetical protein [Helicobacter didelphidarum]RDU62697.1 hypothetical protein CQA53_09125 [Helicobacter didelphidarum]